jgi:hypothetical protein
MVDHDAADGADLASPDGKERTNSITEGEHAAELAMVAKNEEVGCLNNRANIILMTFVDKYVFGTGYPFEKIGEDVRSDNMDIG